MTRVAIFVAVMAVLSSPVRADLISPSAQNRFVYAHAQFWDEEFNEYEDSDRVEGSDFGLFDETVALDLYGMQPSATQISEILADSVLASGTTFAEGSGATGSAPFGRSSARSVFTLSFSVAETTRYELFADLFFLDNWPILPGGDALFSLVDDSSGEEIAGYYCDYLCLQSHHEVSGLLLPGSYTLEAKARLDTVTDSRSVLWATYDLAFTLPEPNSSLLLGVALLGLLCARKLKRNRV